jgi:hypothetical protein
VIAFPPFARGSGDPLPARLNNFAGVNQMAGFNVYLYNIPKVTEDGKQVVPVPGNEMKDFENPEEAKKFASTQREKFDRVVVMQKSDDGEKLVERYVDGKFERPEDIVRH